MWLNTLEMNGKVVFFSREIQTIKKNENLRSEKHNIWKGSITELIRQKKETWKRINRNDPIWSTQRKMIFKNEQGPSCSNNLSKAQLSYNLSAKTLPPGNFRKSKGKDRSIISKWYPMSQGLKWMSRCVHYMKKLVTSFWLVESNSKFLFSMLVELIINRKTQSPPPSTLSKIPKPPLHHPEQSLFLIPNKCEDKCWKRNPRKPEITGKITYIREGKAMYYSNTKPDKDTRKGKYRPIFLMNIDAKICLQINPAIYKKDCTHQLSIPGMQSWFNIHKSIWYTILPEQRTIYRIILMHGERALDRIQHPFMIRLSTN